MAYKTKRTTKTTENTQWCENQTSARPHCVIDTAVNAWKHREASILQIIAYKYDFGQAKSCSDDPRKHTNKCDDSKACAGLRPTLFVQMNNSFIMEIFRKLLIKIEFIEILMRIFDNKCT